MALIERYLICQPANTIKILTLSLSLSLSPLLHAAIPPVLTHGDLLKDQVVLTGSRVVLPCAASGAPRPTYTWTRAGQSQPINIDAESKWS